MNTCREPGIQPVRAAMTTSKPTDRTRLPAAVSERLRAATGAADTQLAERLVGQLVESLWLPPALDDGDRHDRIAAAVAALEGLAPRDAVEGLLAVELVAAHGAALECLRRAMLPGQPSAAVDLCMRQATKLLALTVRQAEFLDRHRGKGEQKVTVEHVQVAAGGQAIVGAVAGRRV